MCRCFLLFGLIILLFVYSLLILLVILLFIGCFWGLVVWGEVGVVFLFFLVFFIMVEFFMFCFCYDERFLNLWIKDFLFKLDYFFDLFRYILFRYF